MEYRLDSETKIIARLEPGEEVMESIKAICKKEGFDSAEVRGIGVSKDLKVNNAVVFNDGTKYEVTSIMGTVSQKLGDIFMHIRLTAADPDGKIIGGHLNYCVISGTCEMFIEKTAKVINRKEAEGRPGVYWLDLA